MSSENGSSQKRRRVTGKALFSMGLCVGTPGARLIMQKHDLHPLLILARHAAGDWGDVGHEDAAANERALIHGDRLMSVYKFGEDVLYVITEADRETTTILDRDEY